jgi:hypothetical protein
MKVFLAGLFCVALVGCASLSNPAALADMSKIALVSVVSNADIDWAGERSSGGLLGNVLTRSSNAGGETGETAAALLSRADTLIDDAEKAVLGALGTVTGMTALPKDAVLSSATYQGAKESTAKGAAILKADGYRFVAMNDTALAKGLASEVGADGSVHVSFQFAKAMKSGVAKNGTMGAQVVLSVNVLNSAGKLVFSKSYQRIGGADIKVALGIYNPLELQGAFAGAIADVCADLVKDMSR